MHAPLQPVIGACTPARYCVVDDLHNVELLLLRIRLHLHPATDAIGDRTGNVRIAADVHDRRLDQAANFVGMGRRDRVRRLKHFAELPEGAPPSDDLPEFGR